MSAATLPLPRRVALAYLELFGTPEKRTVAQQLVVADLEGFCYEHRVEAETDANATIDINQTLVNIGRRTVWLRVRGQIARATQPEAKVQVTRRRINP
jgi:hypothetical protein